MKINRFAPFIQAVLVVALAATPFARSKTVALTFDACIKELVKKSDALSSKNRIRIAVFEFTSTQQNSAAPSTFGSYFSEHLLSALSGNTRFKIFERSRLDAVTSELALNQTGLIDEQSAKKIGELAPIDYLLTGTFTKLKNAVEINGRILDVVTGEITTAFSPTIALTEDLAALFPQPAAAITAQTGPSTANPAAPVDNCDVLISKLKPLLKTDAFREIVDVMVTVPFSHTCSYLHGEIARILHKEHFIDKAYHAFFMKEIAAAGDPDALQAPISAGLFYFGADGAIDDSEWKCIANMLRRSHRCESFIRTLFGGMPGNAPIESWYRLMDVCMSTDMPYCGTSGSSQRAAVFLYLLPAYIDDSKDTRLMEYWWLHHAGKLAGGDADKALKRCFEYYHPDYIVKVDSSAYVQAMKRIIFLERHCTPNADNATDALFFINKLEHATDILFPDQWRPFFSRQTALFGDSCSEILRRQFTLYPDDRRLEIVFPFCLRHDIRIPGRVPSIEELASRLTDKSIKKRIEAGELLAQAGNKTVSVLPQLQRALERSTADNNESGNPNLQYALLDALANSGTGDPDILTLIISMLEQPEYTGLPQKTRKTICAIGPRIFPQLEKEFPSKNPAIRVMMIESIKMMGKRGTECATWLKQIRASTLNIDEKDAIDDALEAIGG